MGAKKVLKEIPIDLIRPNPDNPRIVFRQEELDDLLISIKKIDIQVPISVYEDRGKYILIDGERRLRVCKKLNYDKIPAIVQEKPSPLNNLLLMFNIHSLREQWDIFTIASKLPEIIKLFWKEKKYEPNESELSNETGLSRSTIRRCKLIMDLPDRFKEIILNELKKPKNLQTFSEDFFLEMETALKTVVNNFPIYEDNIDQIRTTLIKKYENDTISNITDFRLLRKIATAPNNLDFTKENAENCLTTIFNDNEIGIETIYKNSVETKYDEKKLISNIDSFIYHINLMREDSKIDSEIKDKLAILKNIIDNILSEDN
ncbi:MAG: ParB/RepB/Spo0J family partition protein [Candidatus Kapaibacterium sp.]